MLSLLAKLVMALVVIASGTAAGTAATGSLGHLQLNATSGNLTAAEQAAISYVDQYYSGNATAKVLKVENDTENGSAVFDITVLAPNGHTYDVEVSQATNTVISAELVGSGDNSNNSSSDDSGSQDSQSNDNQGSDQNSGDSGSSSQDNSTATDN